MERRSCVNNRFTCIYSWRNVATVQVDTTRNAYHYSKHIRYTFYLCCVQYFTRSLYLKKVQFVRLGVGRVRLLVGNHQ